MTYKISHLIRVGLSITALCFVLFLVVAPIAFAGPVTSGDYIPLAPIPGVAEEGGANLSNYLPNLYRLGIGLAAAIAVIMLAWGGIRYMTSEVISSKSAAVGQMRNAVGGLILALSSFVLLNTINPDLVSFRLGISEVGVNIAPPTTNTSGDDTDVNGLNDVLNLLDYELARIDLLMDQNPGAVKECYGHYSQMVTTEKNFLAGVINIIRETNPDSSTLTYTDILADIAEITTPLSLIPWDTVITSIGDLVNPGPKPGDADYDPRNDRFNRINEKLEYFMETDVKGAADGHPALTRMTEEQKANAGQRLKKAGSDMTAVVNAVRGGSDAYVPPWENYDYCSEGDQYAGAIADNGPLDTALASLTAERAEAIMVRDLAQQSTTTESNVGLYECSKIYANILAIELAAVSKITEAISSSNLNVTQRHDALNVIKNEADNDIFIIVPRDTDTSNTHMTRDQLINLQTRGANAKKEVRLLAPTPCRTYQAEWDSEAIIFNDPKGCGGGTEPQIYGGGMEPSTTVSTSYDSGICEIPRVN